MKDQKKAEDIAGKRVQVILPLLEAGLDPSLAREKRTRICQDYGLSERTLRRYLAEYREQGFTGLKPKGKGRPESQAIRHELMEQAILLRREVPSRSIAQIIQILEWEGKVLPGEIKRSTLQEKLAERGYSSRQMRMYADSGVAARRFQHRHRNQLIHSDIKYGPYLPIGPGGTMKQVFLVTFIDDATRFVLHGAFYPTLDQIIVEDAFRQTIQKYGVPQSVYFDNGKQYRTKWMARTCSKLGIRLLYAKPYSPEATGKVERFNQVVDSFLRESLLEKPKTLERLNELFQIWLCECYNHKPHSALNNVSPQTVFNSDSHPLRFVDADVLANAFLHSESRKVDKSGCINFMGKKYEVGLSFIGCKVDVVYDPADITELTIEYAGYTSWQVRELEIGERAGKRPKLPEQITLQEAISSRLLQAAGEKNKERQRRQIPAISYRSVGKEDENHV
ncbi:DDE-type integrase/transposase/recombinase [Dehalobacter restrictus]|uniref:DDE-type integrase/transposase/recombinase n=1 Tax=Dehalobacter restrictus TaxID=55583 RepID=A0A857DI82_9FIRM|nr:DDE-type integrase/transposase/recombinase [Dehalobacter restrictus]QHA01050.1 DDE-type integrase/transposase/recombinase [Dehalobacter restrictus]